MSHHSQGVKGNGLPVSLPRTLCWFSQWSWSVESDPQWSCDVGTTPEPVRLFWSPGVLETEPDMRDAHTWGSAALTQHFRRVLKCLAQRDTDKRDGPGWSCPSRGGEQDPQGIDCRRAPKAPDSDAASSRVSTALPGHTAGDHSLPCPSSVPAPLLRLGMSDLT